MGTSCRDAASKQEGKERKQERVPVVKLRTQFLDHRLPGGLLTGPMLLRVHA